MAHLDAIRQGFLLMIWISIAFMVPALETVDIMC